MDVNQRITSVYFDTWPSLDLYHDRVQRLENSQVLRLRWYGDGEDDHREEENGIAGRGLLERVFLERKTHHEQWTGEPSVKERVELASMFGAGGSEGFERPLADRGVMSSLSDELLSCFPVGGVGGVQDSAGSSASPAVLGKQVLDSMKQSEEDLRPVVRTEFRRVAFQKEQGIRLSLDLDVRFWDEGASAESASGATVQQLVAGILCRKDFLERDLVRERWAVLEVKLQSAALVENPPEWLAELMGRGVASFQELWAKKSTGQLLHPLMVDRQRFSKFCHAVYCFHSCRIAPYWTLSEGISAVGFGSDDDLSSCAEEDPRNAPSATTRYRVTPARETTQQQRSSPHDAADGGSLPAQHLHSIPLDTTTGDPTPRGGPAPSTTPPRSQESSLKKLAKSLSARVFLPRGKVQPYIKVEPKTFFANERTFLQWFQLAVFLMSFGLALLTFEATAAGVFLISVSVLTVGYANLIFYRRNWFLKNRMPVGYADSWGPGVISAVLLVGLSLAIGYDSGGAVRGVQFQR